MDFIIDLPPYNSYDSILVVVDHLTKMVQIEAHDQKWYIQEDHDIKKHD
jgi:hypothetical protein